MYEIGYIYITCKINKIYIILCLFKIKLYYILIFLLKKYEISLMFNNIYD